MLLEVAEYTKKYSLLETLISKTLYCESDIEEFQLVLDRIAVFYQNAGILLYKTSADQNLTKYFSRPLLVIASELDDKSQLKAMLIANKYRSCTEMLRRLLYT